jgi:hypothetical protein
MPDFGNGGQAGRTRRLVFFAWRSGGFLDHFGRIAVVAGLPPGVIDDAGAGAKASWPVLLDGGLL